MNRTQIRESRSLGLWTIVQRSQCTTCCLSHDAIWSYQKEPHFLAYFPHPDLFNDIRMFWTFADVSNNLNTHIQARNIQVLQMGYVLFPGKEMKCGNDLMVPCSYSYTGLNERWVGWSWLLHSVSYDDFHSGLEMRVALVSLGNLDAYFWVKGLRGRHVTVLLKCYFMLLAKSCYCVLFKRCKL